jgi:hypothetical protein
MTTVSCRLEGRFVDAKKKLPAWVDPATPDRPWFNVHEPLPWLKPRPYLIGLGRENELREALDQLGFVVINAHLTSGSENPERAFLQELTRRLGFNELGAGHWGAFSDRLWDFLTSNDSTPHAIVISGVDELVDSDIYSFIRCVHNLLSLTEGAGLSDSKANRQIEYFFLGRW